MKKVKVFLVLFFIICIACITNVYGADVSVALNVDKTTVNPGDTITVTLNASCEDGLSFIGTKIEYDTNIFTLVNENVPTGWKNYGNGTLELMIDTTNKITSGQVYSLALKVKESAEEGTVKISTTDIEIIDINNIEYQKTKIEKEITIKKVASVVNTNVSNNNQSNAETGTTVSGNEQAGTTTSGNAQAGTIASGNAQAGTIASGNAQAGTIASGNAQAGTIEYENSGSVEFTPQETTNEGSYVGNEINPEESVNIWDEIETEKISVEKNKEEDNNETLKQSEVITTGETTRSTPFTGKEDYLVFGIVFITIVAVVSFISYKHITF